MAKGKMDVEALAIQRATAELERLEPSARARVALYLYLRYTSAGDNLGPGSAGGWVVADAVTRAWERPQRGAKTPVSAPVAPNAPDGTPDADDASGGRSGGLSPGTPPLPPGATPGLDLSGKGSELDDDRSDMDESEPEPYQEPEFEGDGDQDSVDVEI